eukprot:365052-Chlamydomonas_euryale.AAC.14
MPLWFAVVVVGASPNDHVRSDLYMARWSCKTVQFLCQDGRGRAEQQGADPTWICPRGGKQAHTQGVGGRVTGSGPNLDTPAWRKASPHSRSRRQSDRKRTQLGYACAKTATPTNSALKAYGIPHVKLNPGMLNNNAADAVNEGRCPCACIKGTWLG